MSYLESRLHVSRQDRGGIYIPPYGDGCVTAATASPRKCWGPRLWACPARPVSNAGGKPGLVLCRLGRYSQQPPGAAICFAAIGGSNAALNTAYANAGLSGIATNNGFGITFDNAGTTARPAIDPDDRYAQPDLAQLSPDAA